MANTIMSQERTVLNWDDVITAGEPWYKDGVTEMMPQMPTAPANTKNYI